LRNCAPSWVIATRPSAPQIQAELEQAQAELEIIVAEQEGRVGSERPF
jgi:hypothetical protein